jgi:anthranilate synthase component II
MNNTSKNKKVCILDNYDSFTYNLVQLVREQAGIEPAVYRNDKLKIDELDDCEYLILSPGPGLPSEAGLMPELLKRLAPTKKILGICLGHQCIAEVFGGSLINMEKVQHGKGLNTEIVNQDQIFKDLNQNFISARYHSWCVNRDTLPDCLEVTAIDNFGTIMGLKHKSLSVRGLQFHPESVLTEAGSQIIKNWFEYC